MAKQLLRNEIEVRKFLMGSKGGNSLTAPMIFALDYTMSKIVERNKELILRIVYSAYTPSEYETTMEFLNSWTYKLDVGKSGSIKATGEFLQDYEEMRINLDKGQHGSPLENGPDWWYDAREYLADIIYNGNAGHVFGRGPWTRKRDAWKPLIESVGNKIYTWYREGLQKAGINAI